MGINRNIVECKLCALTRTKSQSICINRNIVECKYRANEESGDWRRVLIETLWNVHYEQCGDYIDWSDCINRNIVECKY